MTRFRIHAVGLPHTSITPAFTACAFTERLRKVSSLLHRQLGHEVFLYAGPESQADVSEHIPCITEEERQAVVGNRHFIHASFDYALPHWRKFNALAIEEIGKRIQPQDFIAVMGGLAHKEILDAFPGHIGCELSIGYGGSFAKFRCYESHSWANVTAGAQVGDPNAVNIRWMDTVIPGSLDPAEFPLTRLGREPYHLFMGRLTERKGYQIAIDVCKRLGIPLILAGQHDDPNWKPDWGTWVGVVGHDERVRLMGNAQAFWCPTIYSEPFGNVAIEAQMCGTPVIATDFGAFVETVEHGATGFRCRSFKQFMAAAQEARHLDPEYIRRRAVRLYSVNAVAAQYQEWFERLYTLHGEGWYSLD